MAAGVTLVQQQLRLLFRLLHLHLAVMMAGDMLLVLQVRLVLSLVLSFT
jgi:hypothetical protein